MSKKVKSNGAARQKRIYELGRREKFSEVLSVVTEPASRGDQSESVEERGRCSERSGGTSSRKAKNQVKKRENRV